MVNCDKLAEKYIDKIIEQGKAFEENNDKLTNKLSRESEKVLKEILENNGLQNLTKYLNHNNDYVKFAIANAVFSIEPEHSKKAMMEVAHKDSLLQMVAEITLKEMNDPNSQFNK